MNFVSFIDSFYTVRSKILYLDFSLEKIRKPSPLSQTKSFDVGSS